MSHETTGFIAYSPEAAFERIECPAVTAFVFRDVPEPLVGDARSRVSYTVPAQLGLVIGDDLAGSTLIPNASDLSESGVALGVSGLLGYVLTLTYDIRLPTPRELKEEGLLADPPRAPQAGEWPVYRVHDPLVTELIPAAGLGDW